MRKLGIFFIIFVSFTFFSFNEKVEAAAVPISENAVDESDIEWFIDYAKRTREDSGITCNIYGGKFYKDKGVTYWTANFGQNRNSFIRFKLNNKNYVDWATINRYMPKPTKNSWQEYAMETLTTFSEINAIEDAFMEEIMSSYYSALDEMILNELMAALQKIKTQVEHGKNIEPYDHTSSVYIDEVEKTFIDRRHGTFIYCRSSRVKNFKSVGSNRSKNVWTSYGRT